MDATLHKALEINAKLLHGFAEDVVEGKRYGRALSTVLHALADNVDAVARKLRRNHMQNEKRCEDGRAVENRDIRGPLGIGMSPMETSPHASGGYARIAIEIRISALR